MSPILEDTILNVNKLKLYKNDRIQGYKIDKNKIAKLYKSRIFTHFNSLVNLTKLYVG